MKKIKIKKGDKIVVITGSSKGSTGNVLVLDRENNRVIVEGVNMIKKHAKPSTKSPQGGIVEREASIHISNVALADPKTGDPSRIGFRFNSDGKKERYSKKSNQVL